MDTTGTTLAADDSLPGLSHDQEKAVAILRRMDGPPRKSLRAAELSAVQHAMPKTYVSHTLLHENPSHDRHLSLYMNNLGRRQLQYATNHEFSRKAFIDQQQRKHRIWKQQDETKAAGMNFPTLRADVSGERKVLYKNPRYLGDEEDDVDGKPRIMPYMSIRKERTQFVQFRDKTYMTKLPTVVITDPQKMERYNTYCGMDLLNLGGPVTDSRFQKLANSLSAPATTGTSYDIPDHSHLVTQSMNKSSNTQDYSLPSAVTASAGARRPRKPPTGSSQVVFPSLARSSTMHAAGNPHSNATSVATREITDPMLNSNKFKMKGDQKDSGLNELRHKYGKLRQSYQSDQEGMVSPTLKKAFTVKSMPKVQAEEE